MRNQDRTQVPSSTPISQPDEFLRRARTADTEPLTPIAAAALKRLERAFAPRAITTTSEVA